MIYIQHHENFGPCVKGVSQYVQLLEHLFGQKQITWKEHPELIHASKWRSYNPIWYNGVRRGGPQDRRCETFFKLPAGYSKPPWVNFSQYKPMPYAFERDVNAHIDTKIAMEAGCQFWVDTAVGAILCSNANIPRHALLRIKTRNGEDLVWHDKRMAEFRERQVLHHEEWQTQLCDQAFTQGLPTLGIAPKARPAPRASQAIPNPAQAAPAPEPA